MSTNDHRNALLHYLHFLKNQPKGFFYSDTSGTNKTPTQTKTPQQTPELEQTKQQALDTIKDRCTKCQACPLATQGRSQVVFGEGNPNAQIMFVGEGPGRDEDEQGRPFIGRAGQLLTKIIQAMGLKREDVYISNVVKCRPPGNRVPLPTESDVCKQLILLKEIEIIKPRVICALGATAVQALLGENTKITKVRGIFSDYQGIPLMPTYHPAYLLRNPEAKKIVWEDMKKIIEHLNHPA